MRMVGELYEKNGRRMEREYVNGGEWEDNER
jgi:hypothetical protein